VRKYFPRLLGNASTSARIGAAIAAGTVPHAFLIGGPSGSGKSLLAEEIAMALNCENFASEKHSLPCGVCNRCKRIADGNFTDVKILGKKKDKATLGVGEIKDFREDMFLCATESDKKVYIIDDAETMTVEAQNALLKVLEEPPSGVMIILLAKECDRILTTIKSRTQYIPMSRFAEEDILKFLLERSEEARTLNREDPEKLKSAVMSADGRLGFALRLVDPRSAEENRIDRDTTKALVAAAIGRAKYSELHTAVFSLPTKRSELLSALELAISAVRDLIVIKTAPDSRIVFYTSHTEAEEIAKETDVKRLFAVYDALRASYELCQKNANVGNLLTGLAAAIKSGKSVR